MTKRPALFASVRPRIRSVLGSRVSCGVKGQLSGAGARMEVCPHACWRSSALLLVLHTSS